jgi:tRNA uridine 5-carboxymethylaminomethyl modification enzyme
MELIKNEKERLEKTKIKSTPENEEILKKYNCNIEEPISLYDLLKRPGITYECIKELSQNVIPAKAGIQDPECLKIDYRVKPDNDIPEFEIETEIKYEGYINRQLLQVSQQDKFESIKLPKNMNFLEMIHLSKEAREKLDKIKPVTLGQASRIGGVSPADIAVLLANIKNVQKGNKILIKQ